MIDPEFYHGNIDPEEADRILRERRRHRAQIAEGDVPEPPIASSLMVMHFPLAARRARDNRFKATE